MISRRNGAHAQSHGYLPKPLGEWFRQLTMIEAEEHELDMDPCEEVAEKRRHRCHVPCFK